MVKPYKALSGGGGPLIHSPLCQVKSGIIHFPDAAEDAIDVSVDGKADEDFVIGPSTLQVGFWENRYGFVKNLDVDCGPWPDVPSYHQSITNSERAWIRRFAKPPAYDGRTFIAPWEPPVHLQIPQDHLLLLDQYDKVAKYLIPDDKRLLRPTLNLRDSNSGNIFLSREALERDGTIEISAVIDWQHTVALPLYITAFTPRFIEDAEPAPGQAEDQMLKEKAYLRKAYHALYQETGLDIVWASALSFGGKNTVSQQMPAAVQFCWHGGYVKLRRLLMRTAAEWERIVGSGVHCSLVPPLSEKEVSRVEEDEQTWVEMEAAREAIAGAIGVEDDGWVCNEGYERAVEANEALRKAWVGSLGEEEKRGLGGVDPADIWPFQGPTESR